MKRICIFLVSLFACGTVCAQPADSVRVAASFPEYAYCEIIAKSLPTNNDVVFDFGQKHGLWAYNYLCNEKGERLRFVSGIQALNYMIRRGWEFVQAFVTDEETDHTHYLLRIPCSKLTAEQQQQLLTEPDVR